MKRFCATGVHSQIETQLLKSLSFDAGQPAFQRITAVVPISTGKKMRVGFTLEDGARLVFEASDKPLPSNPPARRPRRTNS